MDVPLGSVLLSEVEARRALAGRTLRFRLIAPPYPVLGVGVLRALRIVERDGITEVAAGYDRYERLERGR